MIRLGIDVGGTNTDAVLVDGDKVRHAVKTATTADVGSGIVTALKHLISESNGRSAAHRRGNDWDDAFHQRRRATPTSRQDRCGAYRSAGRCDARTVC